MRTMYLDNAGTTRVSPEVARALAPWLDDEFGNPSAAHPPGVRAAEAVDRARAQVARAVGARAADVVFTSGGTESNNLAVLGIGRARRAGKVVIGATEHPSVREAALALAREGSTVEAIPLDADGAIDFRALEGVLTPDTELVAQMLVSNEFGTRYPVEALARVVRRLAPRAHLHVDAIQALGNLDFTLEELGVDSLSISGHKIHAPKGVGALVTRPGVALQPLLFGGGQESGRRSGTENVAGIVALGRAAELAAERVGSTTRALDALHRSFVDGLSELRGCEVFAPGAAAAGFSPAICAIRVPGAPAAVWLHHLEAAGVLASAGSACHASGGSVSPSLLAAGLSEDGARRILRFSFSRETVPDDVAGALAALRTVHAELEGLRT